MSSTLNKTLRIDAVIGLVEVKELQKAFEGAFEQSGIFQGDIITALPKMPTGTFDLIVADPPYNFGRDFGNDSDKQTEDQYADFATGWVAAAARLLRPTGSMYVCSDWSHGALYEQALRDAGLKVLNRITWKREKGRGAKRNWKQNMEDIWFAVNDAQLYTFNLDAVKVQKKVIAPYRQDGVPKDWVELPSGERVRSTHPANIWTDMTVPFWSMPENTEHPTQKPEKLVERIILASSNPNDRILDLFSGSGTTSVVAHRLGRRYIGIELNPDYVRLGLKRIERLVSENLPENRLQL